MNGYSHFASSPPTAAAKGARARRSLELTNTKETNAWEGLAIGAVTLARTVSTGSHRLCTSGEKSKGGGGGGHHGGLSGALRRAFSMRRHQAAPGKGDRYYWRIHDMDGDSDRGDENACEQRDEEEEEKGQPQEGEAKEDAKAKRTTTKKKKGSNIFKTCKKLLRL